jgi:hypothetical protein
MAATDTAAKSTAVAKPDKPPFYLVKLTHPNHNDRIVFRSVSLPRARQWVENRFPRGSEAYLEHPDGTTEHHEAERTGEFGMHAEAWAPFDPDTWVPTDQAPPPGDSEWADKEG